MVLLFDWTAENFCIYRNRTRLFMVGLLTVFVFSNPGWIMIWYHKSYKQNLQELSRSKKAARPRYQMKEIYFIST